MVVEAPAVVQIVLPFPPSELSPNSRLHWSQKRQFVSDYRHACRVAAQNVRRDMERQGLTFPLRIPVTAIVTFVLTSRARRIDWDNLIARFKAGQDGLVDAGVLADDSIQAIGHLGYAWRVGAAQEVRVRLQGGDAVEALL